MSYYDRVTARKNLLRSVIRLHRHRANTFKRRAGMLVLALIGLEIVTNLIWIYYT